MTDPAVAPDPLEPPKADVPFDSPEWSQWFYRIYEMNLKDGGVFPKLRVQGKDGTATFSAEKNMFQRLLSIDSGIYSDYSSDNGNIIYGFAANVRRSAGNNITVAAQLNAWGADSSSGGVTGVASTAVSGYKNTSGAVNGDETNVVVLNDALTEAKLGYYAVFKNRFDGETVVKNGLGANRYNYYSSAMWIGSQSRSSTGEKCGWTRGIQFVLDSLDEQTPQAWNAAITYHEGQVVTSGGVCWQALQASTNQLPVVPSLYWVQHTAAGTAALAIGIDFSIVPGGVLPRISSAIRLRDTMRIDYDVTGTVGTWFDPVAGILRLCDSGNNLRFGVQSGSGELFITKAVDALGGGAAAALGTIGATGPTVAAQNSWLRFQHPILGNVWLPIWI